MCLFAQQPLPEWEFLLLAIPAFLFFWSGVIALVSVIAGWHKLAKRFRQEETTFRIGGADNGTTERFGWSTLKMGPKYFPTNYGNCVTVSVRKDGLGLKVMPLFRTLHPPLLIPWTEIESCELDKELTVFDCATIRLRDESQPLRIYGRAGRAIARHWTATQSEDNRRDRHT